MGIPYSAVGQFAKVRMVAMRNFVLLGALGGALAQDGYYASTDRVMGGRSNANVANSDGALRFTGDVNLNGGGFANMVLWWDNGMDLRGFAGIALDFDAVPASEFGAADVGDLHLSRADGRAGTRHAAARHFQL